MSPESTLPATAAAEPSIADEDRDALAGEMSPTRTRPAPERRALAAARP
jgi:hypothetical protein